MGSGQRKYAGRVRDAMAVLHVPYYDSNPYQKLLFSKLNCLGVDAQGGCIHRRSFFDTTIIRAIRQRPKPDIIHFHWLHPFLVYKGSKMKMIIKSLWFLVEILIAKMVGVKIVWTAHNLKNHENININIEIYFTKCFLKLVDGIIVHGETIRTELINLYKVKKKEKVHIVSHGNYIDYYPNAISKKSARESLHISPSEIFFLFFGAIRYYKGVLELIDAFKKVDRSNVRLFVVGQCDSEPLAKEIWKKCRERNNTIQVIMDFVPDEDIQKYINAADVMVFPYQDILTSGAIILAMSFGKPIIAPDFGFIRETVDSRGGFLYNLEEGQGLISAMEQAIGVKETLSDMGMHNLDVVKKSSWFDIAAMTRKIYEECLKNT